MLFRSQAFSLFQLRVSAERCLSLYNNTNRGSSQSLRNIHKKPRRSSCCLHGGDAPEEYLLATAARRRRAGGGAAASSCRPDNTSSPPITASSTAVGFRQPYVKPLRRVPNRGGKITVILFQKYCTLVLITNGYQNWYYKQG